MSENCATPKGRYVYALVREQDADAIVASGLTGLNDQQIESSTADGLAVISSPIEIGVIRPQRKSLAAHQRVVAEIAKQWNMLPVSFGLVAEDSSELESILSANYEDVVEALDRVSGKIEMNVVLTWTAPNVFEYLVARHSELQSARDIIASGQASRDDMIEIGRSVEAILKSTRESHLQTLVDALQDVSTQIDPQDPKQESEIVRLNCLIDRDGEPAFEAALKSLASMFNDEFAFRYNGPWPPYSFVSLQLAAG